MDGTMRIIAIEEHFWSRDFASHFSGNFDRAPKIMQKLEDVSAIRIGEMDEAGIDMQVISHEIGRASCRERVYVLV